MPLKGWTSLTFVLLLALGLPPALVVAAEGVGVFVSGDAGTGTLAGDGGSARPLDYAAAESAGAMAEPNEIQSEGHITGFRDGDRFAQVGSVALLRTDGRKRLVPGDDYVAFQDEGEVGDGVPGAGISGRLLRNAAILRVLDSGSGTATARVLKLYGSLEVGDQLRSRATQRRAYARLLESHEGSAKAAHGVVVGMFPPTLFASVGDVVAVNFGYRKGARPGLRLRVRSEPDAEATAFGNDDDSNEMPKAPIQPIPGLGGRENSGDVAQALPSGDIAVLEVVNAGKDACVARVLREISPVSLGDQVLSR